MAATIRVISDGDRVAVIDLYSNVDETAARVSKIVPTALNPNTNGQIPTRLRIQKLLGSSNIVGVAFAFESDADPVWLLPPQSGSYFDFRSTGYLGQLDPAGLGAIQIQMLGTFGPGAAYSTRLVLEKLYR